MQLVRNDAQLKVTVWQVNQLIVVCRHYGRQSA